MYSGKTPGEGLELGEEKGAGKSGGAYWPPPQVTPSRKAGRGNGLGVLTNGANLHPPAPLVAPHRQQMPAEQGFRQRLPGAWAGFERISASYPACQAGEMYK